MAKPLQKDKIKILLTFFLFTVSLSYSLPVSAFQSTLKRDSSYYVSYSRLIIGRVYLSQKFTSLQVKNNEAKYNLQYAPNTTLNLGLGVTYRWATLNLAYGFGFLNPERGRGKTKYLDLQFHNYGQKIVLDVFGQFYKGFYLTPKGLAANEGSYYTRPDLRVNLMGASAQYVFNNKRFSYRASYIQNEWQKKSAGSVLVGFEAYVGQIRADSSIIPSVVNNDLQFKIRSIDFFEFGPNVGYAHTLVIKRHFFITGSLSLSFDFGSNTWADESRNSSKYGYSTNTFFRFFTGYNSAKWGVSLGFVNNTMRLASDNINRRMNINTGNVRLSYVYRFTPGAKTKKYLKQVP